MCQWWQKTEDICFSFHAIPNFQLYIQYNLNNFFILSIIKPFPPCLVQVYPKICKSKVIDSLINQFSQRNNYLFQKGNTDKQLETNLECVKSKERLKSKKKKTEKIITTANNNKTEDTGERKSEKDSETNISNNKSSEKDISYEVEPTNTPNSHKNIENNDTERGKDVTLQNQEISPEKNFTPSSTEKHISHDTRANNSKISGNQKSVIILGDSMTKLLNGWEMAKKIQSNCKIYVKTFSGATVSCMEDYMKPSLRNPPDHFILDVGTNDICSEKCSMEIAESIINLACSLKMKSMTSVFQLLF